MAGKLSTKLYRKPRDRECSVKTNLFRKENRKNDQLQQQLRELLLTKESSSNYTIQCIILDMIQERCSWDVLFSLIENCPNKEKREWAKKLASVLVIEDIFHKADVRVKYKINT